MNMHHSDLKDGKRKSKTKTNTDSSSHDESDADREAPKRKRGRPRTVKRDEVEGFNDAEVRKYASFGNDAFLKALRSDALRWPFKFPLVRLNNRPFITEPILNVFSISNTLQSLLLTVNGLMTGHGAFNVEKIRLGDQGWTVIFRICVMDAKL